MAAFAKDYHLARDPFYDESGKLVVELKDPWLDGRVRPDGDEDDPTIVAWSLVWTFVVISLLVKYLTRR